MLKFKYQICICFIIYSCKSSLNSSVDLNIYYENYKDCRKYFNKERNIVNAVYYNGKPFDSCYIGYDSINRSVILLQNYKNDKLIGDQLVFGLNNKLLVYRFFIGSNTYTFEQEFDVDGRVISKLDKPLVYSNANFSGIKDMLEVQMVFAKVPYKDLRIQISTDGKNYRDVQLVSSKYYLNNYEYIYKQDTKGKNKINIYVKMQCIYYLNEPQVFYDTLSYSR